MQNVNGKANQIPPAQNKPSDTKLGPIRSCVSAFKAAMKDSTTPPIPLDKSKDFSEVTPEGSQWSVLGKSMLKQALTTLKNDGLNALQKFASERTPPWVQLKIHDPVMGDLVINFNDPAGVMMRGDKQYHAIDKLPSDAFTNLDVDFDDDDSSAEFLTKEQPLVSPQHHHAVQNQQQIDNNDAEILKKKQKEDAEERLKIMQMNQQDLQKKILTDKNLSQKDAEFTTSFINASVNNNDDEENLFSQQPVPVSNKIIK